MKKTTIIVVSVILAIFLLLPLPLRLKDGGTVEYKAILYKVSVVHSFASEEERANGKMYNEGVIVKILGFEVFNNVK